MLPTGYGKSMIYAILPLLFDNMLGKLSLGYIVLGRGAANMPA